MVILNPTTTGCHHAGENRAPQHRGMPLARHYEARHSVALTLPNGPQFSPRGAWYAVGAALKLQNVSSSHRRDCGATLRLISRAFGMWYPAQLLPSPSV